MYELYKMALGTGKMTQRTCKQVCKLRWQEAETTENWTFRIPMWTVDATKSTSLNGPLTKFPECKQAMSEKEITKFFKRVVKSKTYQTLSEKRLF